MRRCIGCYGSFPQDELIRFTVQSGRIVADAVYSDNAGCKDATPFESNSGTQKKVCASGNDGRGFYLCENRDCFDRAQKKKAFNRVMKRNIDPDELKDIAELFGNAK